MKSTLIKEILLHVMIRQLHKILAPLLSQDTTSLLCTSINCSEQEMNWWPRKFFEFSWW